MPLIQVNGSEKGVNLMTAHGSKGLEYEYIFIAGCNAAGWEKKRKPAGGYSLPDTLFVSLSPNAEEEELRRLFYVALTRAQKYRTRLPRQMANKQNPVCLLKKSKKNTRYKQT